MTLEPRIAANLLTILRPQLEQANAVLEAGRALQAIAYPAPAPDPERAAPEPEAEPVKEDETKSAAAAFAEALVEKESTDGEG